MTVTICCESMFRAIQFGAITHPVLEEGKEECTIEHGPPGRLWYRKVLYCPFCGNGRPILVKELE